jgi:hypothetical protein
LPFFLLLFFNPVPVDNRTVSNAGHGLPYFDYVPPDDGFYEYNAPLFKKSQYARQAAQAAFNTPVDSVVVTTEFWVMFQNYWIRDSLPKNQTFILLWGLIPRRSAAVRISNTYKKMVVNPHTINFLTRSNLVNNATLT